MQVATLLRNPKVQGFLKRAGNLRSILESLSHAEAYVILCLPAMGQSHVLIGSPKGEAHKSYSKI